MTASCDTPIPFAELVDYAAGDLEADALDRVEEHLMSCAACTSVATRVLTITRAIGALPRPILPPEELAALRARGFRIVENHFVPGRQETVSFSPDTDILLHRLGGLDLTDCERVHVIVRAEKSGEVLNEDPSAPFDRDRGEILIACQRHFAVLPPDIEFEVHVHREGGEVVERYLVPHAFT